MSLSWHIKHLPNTHQLSHRKLDVFEMQIGQVAALCGWVEEETWTAFSKMLHWYKSMPAAAFTFCRTMDSGGNEEYN